MFSFYDGINGRAGGGSEADWGTSWVAIRRQIYPTWQTAFYIKYHLLSFGVEIVSCKSKVFLRVDNLKET